MSMNLDGKKTSLKEEAEIYKKRTDKESEHDKLKKMNGRQKASYFATYYLPVLLIIAAVAAVVCYLLWADVINKRDIVLRCAIINEPIPDSILTEFSDNFTTSIGENPDKITSSFYIYYTRSDIAAETGANAANDLSEITSRIVAADLGCMIAGEADGKNYRDNGFFLKLDDFLSKEEYTALKDYLYTCPDGEKISAGSYGIYLDQSPVYQELVKELPSPIEKPIFSIITNSDETSREYARKLIHYFFPDILN
ncbi:MAG: hypothetical protein SOZ48_07625 [Eubacterium sp.]|nr:hypothetical protein [Eubacterium sp.]